MEDTELLSHSEWDRVVENRLGTRNFDILRWTVKPMNSTGGFLGDHYLALVTIRFREPDSKDATLHFFLKSEPLKISQRKITEQIDAFKKEVDTLNILFPKVRTALNENGKNMPWTCKCYYTRPDIMVLEDLSQAGFRNFTLRDTMNVKHFVLAIEVLANLHSSSLIFEEKQGSTYSLESAYPKLFREALFRHAPNHPGTAWLEAGVKGVLCLLELIRGKDAVPKMKAKIEEVMGVLYEMAKPSKRFRNAIGQGDVKRDNILFLHESDEPVEAILVDYQFVRYAPPANDVMCLLYLSANREFREEYGPQLLATYYERLSKNLQEHGLNAGKILPWEEFQESCEFYKIYAIILATIYGPGTFMRGEDIGHIFESSEKFEHFVMVDRSPELIHCFNTDEFYRKNVTQLIEELIEECVEKDFPRK